MAKNKISDLRNHLFETLEALKDKEKPMEIERARAISTVASTIIQTARVELDAYELLGEGEPANFFPEADEKVPKAQRMSRMLRTGMQ
jgi:hypothetical protein